MSSKSMKAWKLYAPADLRYEDVPVPKIGPGEVLVKVQAVGVCGSDISRLMETGTYHFPTICGHEFAGEVVEVAPDVSNCKVGDRVTVIPLLPCGTCDFCRLGQYQLCDHYNYLGSRTDGAYAEYVKVWASNVLHLPPGVPFEAGAMTDPAAVALHAVRRLPLQPGQSVAVLGLGPIGLLAVQWAKLLGAGKVVAIDIFPEKLDVALQLGADYVINSREEDPVKKVRELLGGVNHAVEFAGHKVTQDQALRLLAKRGHAVFGGISHTDLPLSAEAVDRLLRYELSLHGSWNSSFATLDENDWRVALEFMGTGQLKTAPIITHRLPLKELKDAIQMMYERRTYFGKVMFFPGSL